MSARYGTLNVAGAKLCFKVRGRGPALLVVQGGEGNADSADAFASALAHEYTIITYDRRGLSRSPLDDQKQTITLEQHAEDAQALIEELVREPALVFGSSLGALIGLELVRKHPDSVQLLVAHDPLALDLLSAEEQLRLAELRKEVAELALSEGMRFAMRRFLHELGVDKEDREDDVEPPASTRERSRDSGFFMARESRAADRFRVDLPALRGVAHKIVPAFGESSRDRLPSRCALSLAARLGRDALAFPGGHSGYALRPRAFADALRSAVLSSYAPSGTVEVGGGSQFSLVSEANGRRNEG
ncbi:MAG TPA: alpha/beta hydrolase [Polyangiaceae bacterium]|nr:alpha/beta hydrolase [Polyangiaceae bacterium]